MGQDLVIVSIKLANGKGKKCKIGRPNDRAGCTKFGNLINEQGAIRAGRVSNFSELKKQACPFIRQMRVDGKAGKADAISQIIKLQF